MCLAVVALLCAPTGTASNCTARCLCMKSQILTVEVDALCTRGSSLAVVGFHDAKPFNLNVKESISFFSAASLGVFSQLFIFIFCFIFLCVIIFFFYFFIKYISR